jgi:hypothetical protein
MNYYSKKLTNIIRLTRSNIVKNIHGADLFSEEMFYKVQNIKYIISKLTDRVLMKNGIFILDIYFNKLYRIF